MASKEATSARLRALAALADPPLVPSAYALAPDLLVWIDETAEQQHVAKREVVAAALRAARDGGSVAYAPERRVVVERPVAVHPNYHEAINEELLEWRPEIRDDTRRALEAFCRRILRKIDLEASRRRAVAAPTRSRAA